MAKDDMLSNTLIQVEERKKHYLARQVESSDQDRVEEVEEDAKVDRMPTQPATGVSDLRASVAGDVSPLLETDDDHPDGVICTWIECALDRRSWAEVTETLKESQGHQAAKGMQGVCFGDAGFPGVATGGVSSDSFPVQDVASRPYSGEG